MTRQHYFKLIHKALNFVTAYQHNILNVELLKTK